MNFFGVVRNYLVPFSLIFAMFPTFAPMSGAQEAVLSNFLHSTGGISRHKTVGPVR